MTVLLCCCVLLTTVGNYYSEGGVVGRGSRVLAPLAVPLGYMVPLPREEVGIVPESREGLPSEAISAIFG